MRQETQLQKSGPTVRGGGGGGVVVGAVGVAEWEPPLTVSSQ